MSTRYEYRTSGLINTRGVSDNLTDSKLSYETLTYTKEDLDIGHRIGPSTLNFDNNEKRTVRAMNRYVFNKIALEMIWNLDIELHVIPKGMMSVHPTLIQIRMFDGENIIDSALPNGLIDRIVKAINDSIGRVHYDVKYLHLDQIEGLASIGLIPRPDVLLERLVGIAETRGDLDVSQLNFKRMIPDSLTLSLTIQRILK